MVAIFTPKMTTRETFFRKNSQSRWSQISCNETSLESDLMPYGTFNNQTVNQLRQGIYRYGES